MINVLRRWAQSGERAQLMTLLCRVSDRGRPLATPKIHDREVIALDGTVSDVQVHTTMSRADTVERLVPIKTLYQPVRSVFKGVNSTVVVGDALGGHPVVIAGAPPPILRESSAVENKEQWLTTVRAVKESSEQIQRGRAFNPRILPCQFQGRGALGLQLLAEAPKETGLPIITEVMKPGLVEVVAEYADGLQIGRHTIHTFPLLVAARQKSYARPVLLKRGLSATIESWRRSVASMLVAGNPKVILCERGRRSADPQTRTLLDLACVPLFHVLTHLPIIVNPSHDTSRSELVPTMSCHRGRGTRANTFQIRRKESKEDTGGCFLSYCIESLAIGSSTERITRSVESTLSGTN